MSLKDKMEADSKSQFASKGGSWFKFKEGDNKVRVLAEPQAIYKDFKLGYCYHNCGFQGNMKYLTYVLDYSDNKIKPAELPIKVFETIAGLEQHEDYAFTGFPMPYDITINAVDAGTKEVKYTVLPRAKKTDLADEVLTELNKKKAIDLLIEILQNKNEEKHRQDGTWERIHADLEKEAQDRKESFAKVPRAKPGESIRAEGSIEYPEEEANPADIPF